MENQPVQNPIPELIQPVNQTPVNPIKAGNFLVLLLSVLLIIGVGIAGLFYFQIQKLSKQLAGTQIQSNPTPTVSQAPNGNLANWKTYTDEKYGFSFAYPQDWKTTTLADSGLLTLSNVANDHTISLSVGRVTGFGYCYKYGNSKKIIVGGKDAETADGIGGTEMCDQPKEVISKRGNTYALIPLNTDNTLPPNQIHISYDYPLSDMSIAKSNLNQILSTFKFLGQNDQVLGIQINTCCSCPTKIPRSLIGTDGWVLYEKGKNYAEFLPEECDRVDCQPCPP